MRVLANFGRVVISSGILFCRALPRARPREAQASHEPRAPIFVLAGPRDRSSLLCIDTRVIFSIARTVVSHNRSPEYLLSSSSHISNAIMTILDVRSQDPINIGLEDQTSRRRVPCCCADH
ncbi:uncharacterized protein M421DRAFT_190992 [Didymella exigua CBS 183.55]|uniref:Uncharacterized protein n=1 Tax=Didymella exigua CBS 183.55 TaxID=1150837 RepID=A0A6A5S040_9PLEO|nr:uncharacterized protein M421DRAFT_190992 [Didymella exigua CBS 183.55]KAF1933159.1 hypothetical protein M421DRAFT_190992 [Didymella exigua CBS 183.55]